MSWPRFLRLFKPDFRISPTPFTGYSIWTMIFLVASTAVASVFFNASLHDAFQQILLITAMALSYDVFSGYVGAYNLGFGAFVGIGAYAFAVVSNSGLGTVPSFVIAGFASAAFAVAISYPFLRLRGGYFAIGTLAFAVLLYSIDINFFAYTGGTVGIRIKEASTLGGPSLFFGSLLLVIIVMQVHLGVGRTKLGLALRSIKEDEDVAQSVGINVFRMKQLVLVVSAFFAGICGALYATYLGFVSADTALGLGAGLFPVAAAIIGGSGVYLGVIVGSFLLTWASLTIPGLVSSFYFYVSLSPLVFIGIILILVGVLIPEGILSFRVFKKYARARPDKVLIGRFGEGHAVAGETSAERPVLDGRAGPANMAKKDSARSINVAALETQSRRSPISTSLFCVTLPFLETNARAQERDEPCSPWSLSSALGKTSLKA
jgi:branched-chain amino acid transport system permease protein